MSEQKKQYWRDWWKAAAIRALKTFAQTAASVIGVSATLTLEEINWIVVLSTSAVAAILSLLTSLAGIPEVEQPIEIDNKEI